MADTKVLEKTAQFVALKGALFEDRLRAAESANAKFAFLLRDNKEHEQFRSRVAFHLAQLPAAAPEAPPAPPPTPPAAPAMSPTPPVADAAPPPSSPTQAPAESRAASADGVPLRVFLGTGELLKHAAEFEAEQWNVEEVLELTDAELPGLGTRARAAFWLRRLLAGVSGETLPLLQKWGNVLESKFRSAPELAALSEAQLAAECGKLGLSPAEIASIAAALEPIRKLMAASTPPPDPPAAAAAAAPPGDAAPAPARAPLSEADLEAAKVKFRAERLARRQAEGEGHVGARRKQSKELVDKDLLAAGAALQYAYRLAAGLPPDKAAMDAFADPAEEAAASLALIASSPTEMAQTAMPTVSDEERVLELLARRLEMERQVGAQAQEERKAATVASTLSSGMPPLKSPSAVPPPPPPPASCSLIACGVGTRKKGLQPPPRPSSCNLM